MTDLYKQEGNRLMYIFNYHRNKYGSGRSIQITSIYSTIYDEYLKTTSNVEEVEYNISGKLYKMVFDFGRLAFQLKNDDGKFVMSDNEIYHLDNNNNASRLNGPAYFTYISDRCISYSWMVNSYPMDKEVNEFEKRLQKKVYDFTDEEMEIFKFEMMLAAKS